MNLLKKLQLEQRSFSFVLISYLLLGTIASGTSFLRVHDPKTSQEIDQCQQECINSAGWNCEQDCRERGTSGGGYPGSGEPAVRVDICSENCRTDVTDPCLAACKAPSPPAAAPSPEPPSNEPVYDYDGECLHRCDQTPCGDCEHAGTWNAAFGEYDGVDACRQACSDVAQKCREANCKVLRKPTGPLPIPVNDPHAACMTRCDNGYEQCKKDMEGIYSDVKGRCQEQRGDCRTACPQNPAPKAPPAAPNTPPPTPSPPSQPTPAAPHAAVPAAAAPTSPRANCLLTTCAPAYQQCLAKSGGNAQLQGACIQAKTTCGLQCVRQFSSFISLADAKRMQQKHTKQEPLQPIPVPTPTTATPPINGKTNKSRRLRKVRSTPPTPKDIARTNRAVAKAMRQYRAKQKAIKKKKNTANNNKKANTSSPKKK